MRKDIFESEEELIEVINVSIQFFREEYVDSIDFAESIKEAKRLGIIKQSPLEKLSDAWNILYSQRYTYRIKPSDRGVVENNDQWVKAATGVINAQEELIEYLKQKLEEQS